MKTINIFHKNNRRRCDGEGDKSRESWMDKKEGGRKEREEKRKEFHASIDI